MCFFWGITNDIQLSGIRYSLIQVIWIHLSMKQSLLEIFLLQGLNLTYQIIDEEKSQLNFFKTNA